MNCVEKKKNDNNNKNVLIQTARRLAERFVKTTRTAEQIVVKYRHGYYTRVATLNVIPRRRRSVMINKVT